MKRVLVTGGSGFFGSILVKTLLERGYEVKILDLFKDKELAKKGVDLIELLTNKSYIKELNNFFKKRTRKK